jgi:putative ABC transport system substrate-binding protein
MAGGRRLFWVSLWLVTASLLLSGCDQPPPAPAPPHVGVVLFGESRRVQSEGFVEGLRQLGHIDGETIRLTLVDAMNDRLQLEELVDRLQREGVDLMVAAGGLEADAVRRRLVGRPSSPPVVVIYVNAIIERGLVESRTDSGWQVTGVDNLNAELTGRRLELLHDLLPSAKRILLYYHPRIEPSLIGLEVARRTAEGLGLTIDARAVRDQDALRADLDTLAHGSVDALLLVPAAPIENAIDLLLTYTDELGIPLVALSRAQAEQGATISYGASFHQIGVQAARLADKVLRGQPARTIPFEPPRDYLYTLNRSRLKQLGIELTPTARAQVNDFIE